MKVYFGILVLFAFFISLTFSCKKSSENPDLKASIWLETKDRKDTIVFANDFLTLYRPRELQNGRLLPKIGAGPYMFKALKDSIGLMHSLSSLYKFNNYSFKMEQKKLYIGDFYQKGSAQVLVFERLR